MYATMEEQWLIVIKLKQSECFVCAIFTDVADFDNEHKCTSVS